MQQPLNSFADFSDEALDLLISLVIQAMNQGTHDWEFCHRILRIMRAAKAGLTTLPAADGKVIPIREFPTLSAMNNDFRALHFAVSNLLACMTRRGGKAEHEADFVAMFEEEFRPTSLHTALTNIRDNIATALGWDDEDEACEEC